MVELIGVKKEDLELFGGLASSINKDATQEAILKMKQFKSNPTEIENDLTNLKESVRQINPATLVKKIANPTPNSLVKVNADGSISNSSIKEDSSGNLVYKINSNPAYVVSFSTFNDNNSHTIAVEQLSSFEIILKEGRGGIRIPFYTTGGELVAWRFTYLHPTNGWVINSSGVSMTFIHDSFNANTYQVDVSSGTATVSIKRTAGNNSYSVELVQGGL